MKHPVLIAVPLALAACGSDETVPTDERDEVAPTVSPADQDTSGATDSAGSEPDDAVEEPAEDEVAQTMPRAVRGQWRENDLGRDPTREDCNQTSSTNRNFGKVLTVRADGYSLFESGGRIIEVHNRTDAMIDATFDTTYADTPTTARKDFALQPGGSLAVNDDDGDGRLSVTEYLRCPRR